MKRYALALLLASACGAPAPKAGPAAQESLGEEHPLTGKIFDSRADDFVELDTVREEVSRAKFILLGEKHDNPAHHLGQASVLAMVTKGDRKPALVWEMVHRKQGLDEPLYLGSAEAFGESLKWEESGWPSYSMYQPIVEVALGGGLAQYPGNLEPAAMRTAYTESLAGLDSERARAVGVSTTLAGEALEDLRKEIEKGHCGYGDANMLDSMAAAQQSRDAFMAKQMRDHQTADGAVLIAGGGHVRRDRAVPFHLVDSKDVTVDDLLVITWVEVRDDELDPRSYAGDETPVFDLVFFTPRISNEDPCDQFAEQVERIRKQVREEKEGAEVQ
ncbi:MAG: ChaN family lipoprotein [Myxococcota bacterium]